MPFYAQVLKVLIASPTDTKDFRDAVEDALHDWNGHQGERQGVLLLPRRWETDAIPLLREGLRGQSVINAQLVDDADIVFGLFHSRMGTIGPTGVTGTVEELQRTQASGKAVHVYFSRLPFPHDVDPHQLGLVQEFKRQLEQADPGRGLFGLFDSDAHLRIQVARAITYDVQRLTERSTRTNSPATTDTSPVESPAETRAADLNELRQDLFAEILSEVVKGNIGFRSPARGKGHWLNYAGGPFGTWSVNVTNKRRLRVEAHLNSGSRDLNKRLFDEFYSARLQWEGKAGRSLSWERLDDKQVSRIAAYSPVELDIHDRANRDAIRAWAIDAAANLFAALDRSLRDRARILKSEMASEQKHSG